MDDKFVQCEGSLIENMQVPPADGGSKPTPSLQVRPITKREATPVIENYHYSKNVPAGKNLYFGLSSSFLGAITDEYGMRF